MMNIIASNEKLMRIVYIALLVITFFSSYMTIFDAKVSLGGDNASYYILGNALANGEGYTNIHHFEKEAHQHYPPGYPLLIASIITTFSDEVVAIKACNGVFFLGAILLLFFIVKKLTQNIHIAFATSIITLLNYHLLAYATLMMSEIPFLFFSLLCIWLFIKIDLSKPVFKNGQFFLLLIFLSFSFYIRSIGLALLVSFLLFLIVQKRWKYALSLVGGFTMLYLPWMFRNSNTSGNTYVHQLFLKNPYQPELGQMGFSELLERIFLNIERYMTKEIPSSIIYTEEINYVNATTTVLEWCLGLLLIGGIIVGIYKLSQFRTFILIYLLAFFSLLMIWPSVWYGTRFLLPLLPILIFLLLLGIVTFVRWLTEKLLPQKATYSTLLLMLFILSFWTIYYGSDTISKLQAKANTAYTNEYKNYFELAEWIRKNSPATSITCVRKEGLFYLFSKKFVTNYQNTNDREAQIEYLKSKNVTHVVVEQLGYSSTARYLVPTIDRYPTKFKIIKELKAPNTYLMQFLPELGYTGEWKNDQRNGYGTYVWEDGQKYEGYWQNNVRHGIGTVYFENGEQLTGTWQEGKLQGKATKKDKEGKVLEISIYENNVKVKVIDAAN